MTLIDSINALLREAYEPMSTLDLAAAVGCRARYAWQALRRLEREGLALCVNAGDREPHEPLLWVATC